MNVRFSRIPLNFRGGLVIIRLRSRSHDGLRLTFPVKWRSSAPRSFGRCGCLLTQCLTLRE